MYNLMNMREEFKVQSACSSQLQSKTNHWLWSYIFPFFSFFKDEFQKKHGVKFGFMSAFVKASASALKEMPIVNAGNLYF